MARAASKKQAQANEAALKFLHTTSAIIYGIFLLSHLLLARPPSWKPVILICPALGLQYFLERSARPRYELHNRHTSQGPQSYSVLVSSGTIDMKQQGGLLDMFLDLIYFTWILCVVSVVFGSAKVWWGYVLAPLYAGYRAFSVAKGGLQGLMGGMGGAGGAGGVEGGEGGAETGGGAAGVSKRQEKLQKRQEKGGQRTKYR